MLRSVGAELTRTANLSLLLLVAVLAGVLALTLAYPRQSQSTYAITVEQALELAPSGDSVRVRGNLKPGSLCRAAGKCRYRWQLLGASLTDARSLPTLDVLYEGCQLAEFMHLDLPLGIDVEVVVEGTLQAGAKLLASQALAKSPRIAPGDPIGDSHRPLLDCE